MTDFTPSDLARIDRAVAEAMGWPQRLYPGEDYGLVPGGEPRPGVYLEPYAGGPRRWSPTTDPRDSDESWEWARKTFPLALVQLSYFSEGGMRLTVLPQHPKAAPEEESPYKEVVAPTEKIAKALAILELAGVDWRS